MAAEHCQEETMTVTLCGPTVVLEWCKWCRFDHRGGREGGRVACVRVGATNGVHARLYSGVANDINKGAKSSENVG